MTVTITPDQLALIMSDDFLAALHPHYRDTFLVKVREAPSGNYRAVDFGPGTGLVLVALQEFVTGNGQRAESARQLVRQLEAQS